MTEEDMASRAEKRNLKKASLPDDSLADLLRIRKLDEADKKAICRVMNGLRRAIYRQAAEDCKTLIETRGGGGQEFIDGVDYVLGVNHEMTDKKIEEILNDY